MKKFFSLALVALMAIGANAQQTQTAQLRQKMVNVSAKRAERTPKLIDRKAQLLNGEHKLATVNDTDTAMYFPSWNVLKGGWDAEGYAFDALIVQRHQDTVTFWMDNSYIHTQGEFGWAMSSDPATIISQDSDFIVEPGLFTDKDQYYENMLPTLVCEEGSTYYYGQPAVDLYAQYGATLNTYWMSLPATFYYPLTNCMLYNNEQIGGMYTENNIDSWNWDYQNGGSYIFGTGFNAQDYPVLVQAGYTKMPDSLALYFGYEDETMSIDTVTLQFSSFTLDCLPAGSGITVQLFDDNGLIGQYTATAADTVATYTLNPSQTGVPGLYWTHGQLNFPIQATAHGEVMALIYGFNQNGANIGFKADENNLTNTSYHVINGRLRYFWIANLAMSFNVKFENGTGVNDNHDAVRATKSLKNGQLIINKGNKKYSVLGAEF